MKETTNFYTHILSLQGRERLILNKRLLLTYYQKADGFVLVCLFKLMRELDTSEDGCDCLTNG